MAASALFNDFASRIAEIKGHLLPEIKEDLSYSKEEIDQLRGFLVLVHAEIEDFVETRILDEITLRKKQWSAEPRVASGVLMGVIAFCGRNWPATVDSATALPNTDAPRWQFRDMHCRLAQAVTDINRVIRECNHGVRQQNMLSLLLPIGFSFDEIRDLNLLDDLDQLGRFRGETAHRSARRVTQEPDPADVQNRVDRVMENLERLDRAIAQLP